MNVGTGGGHQRFCSGPCIGIILTMFGAGGCAVERAGMWRQDEPADSAPAAVARDAGVQPAPDMVGPWDPETDGSDGVWSDAGLTVYEAGAQADAQVHSGADAQVGAPPDRDAYVQIEADAASGDLCPYDPDKVLPGVCGCGAPDLDSDEDGIADCQDACPTDPRKARAGVCGCGAHERDGDADGVPNCADACPRDPNKTGLGACGCGKADVDRDGNGKADCLDDGRKPPKKKKD